MITTTDPSVLVSVTGLHRRYGDHVAVRRLDLELHRGEILGLLGPNGAGKTTTLDMLTGNLAPDGGRVAIAGHDLFETPGAAKACVGYLPERPPLYRDLTVDEYLDYAAALRRVPRGDRRRARQAAKAACGLAASGRRLIGNLSKGFQQRVGIAQAIVHDPLVVILDEPTVGLDPIQVREIRALIGGLGRDRGVIVSTHILPEVTATCTHVKILHHGALVFADAVGNVGRGDGTFVIRTLEPHRPDAIAGVPGVRAVDALADHRSRVHPAAGAAPAAAVAALVAERGWGLLELLPERETLEQVFVELTAGETA